MEAKTSAEYPKLLYMVLATTMILVSGVKGDRSRSTGKETM